MKFNVRGNGIFDTRSFYREIQGTTLVLFPWKGIWFVKVPKRVVVLFVDRHWLYVPQQWGISGSSFNSL